MTGSWYCMRISLDLHMRTPLSHKSKTVSGLHRIQDFPVFLRTSYIILYDVKLIIVNRSITIPYSRTRVVICGAYNLNRLTLDVVNPFWAVFNDSTHTYGPVLYVYLEFVITSIGLLSNSGSVRVPVLAILCLFISIQQIDVTQYFSRSYCKWFRFRFRIHYLLLFKIY
jgi:hypothetical protein